MENVSTLFYLVDNRDDDNFSTLFDFTEFNDVTEFINFDIPKVKDEVVEHILEYAFRNS